jgi:hypothetical protein
MKLQNAGYGKDIFSSRFDSELLESGMFIWYRHGLYMCLQIAYKVLVS